MSQTARQYSSIFQVMAGSELLMPWAFIDELVTLIDANSSFETKQEPFQTSTDPIQNVETSVNLILKYFETAHKVLSNIYTQEEVRWVFESVPAVKDISRCVVRASEYLSNFTNILENIRDEREACREYEVEEHHHLTAHITSPVVALLSRHRGRQSLADTTEERLLAVSEHIESALAQWHDLHGLSMALDERMRIATEWAEFHNFIMADIEAEIDKCFLQLFEIEENHCRLEGPVDLDFLTQSIHQSPFLGGAKLPFQSEHEKELVLE